MEDVHDVLPIASLSGKPVLSLETGNKLGDLQDLFIDPINGLVLGLTLSAADGVIGLPYDLVHSFGNDAVMVISQGDLRPLEDCSFANYPRASDLVGTNIITVGGNLLGQIRNVFVTLQRPPLVVYSVGESLLDRLLGRESFILASAGHALSDDTERLVVPEDTADSRRNSIEELLNPAFSVRSYESGASRSFHDDTEVVLRDDDMETVLRNEDDDTVIRLRPDLAAGKLG